MKRRIKWTLLLLALLLAVAPFALSQRLRTVEYRVCSDRLSDEATLAVVSDLHNAAYGPGQSALVAAIRAAEPDAVLLTGDMADSLEEMDGVLALLEGLGGEYPMFYVSGNHEYSSGALSEIKAMLREAGARVLEGERALLPGGVCIAGVEDPACLTREEWRAQLNACRAEDGGFTVLLSHRPERVEFYQSGFDLVLSGHAHGGQMRIPGLLNGLWAPNQGWFPKYAGGLYALDGGEMIVSRGLARGALPRLFNRPELVIVRLSPDAQV